MDIKYITISDLNRYIKAKFDIDSNLNNVYLKGEISNFKHHTRGHFYFTLKDENSRLSAVMFNFNASKVNFEPEDGMKVLVSGRISVYEATGAYQIYVNTMEMDGIGNLYLEFEKLKQKLASEGLFNPEHKRPIPKHPKTIGIITAPTGAAIRDILSTIKRRYPIARTILFPALVQGEGAKESVTKQLKKAQEYDLDVIICGRGGGSIEDLWAFNEEIVARAVYNSDKPIVSAVGHEIDYTICDFVADLRAPTPTGAAELVVPSKLEILKYLGDYQARIKSVINSKLTNYTNVLKKLESNYILKNPLSMYEVEEQKLDNILERLTSLMKYKLDKEVTYLNNLSKNISPNILNKLEKEKIKLETIEAKLNLLNPENILKKGYSLTLIDGRIVKSVKEVSKGAILTTKLSDGNIMSEVI